MARPNPDKSKYLSEMPGFREQPRRWLQLPDAMREQGLFPLLLSTTLAEVGGNMVYVVLLERTYQLGGEAASVGGVLLVQSAPQVLLGIWAGSLVDRLGKRKAATLATLANAALVAGLVMGQTIVAVYVLAFLIMLARLVLIPARLALMSQVCSKANLVAANTGSFQVSLLVAGLGLVLSVPPLLFVPVPAKSVHPVE